MSWRYLNTSTQIFFKLWRWKVSTDVKLCWKGACASFERREYWRINVVRSFNSDKMINKHRSHSMLQKISQKLGSGFSVDQNYYTKNSLQFIVDFFNHPIGLLSLRELSCFGILLYSSVVVTGSFEVPANSNFLKSSAFVDCLRDSCFVIVIARALSTNSNYCKSWTKHHTYGFLIFSVRSFVSALK